MRTELCGVTVESWKQEDSKEKRIMLWDHTIAAEYNSESLIPLRNLGTASWSIHYGVSLRIMIDYLQSTIKII